MSVLRAGNTTLEDGKVRIYAHWEKQCGRYCRVAY